MPTCILEIARIGVKSICSVTRWYTRFKMLNNMQEICLSQRHLWNLWGWANSRDVFFCSLIPQRRTGNQPPLQRKNNNKITSVLLFTGVKYIHWKTDNIREFSDFYILFWKQISKTSFPGADRHSSWQDNAASEEHLNTESNNQHNKSQINRYF